LYKSPWVPFLGFAHDAGYLYEEEKQIVARIREFLGSPSFEELKGEHSTILFARKAAPANSVRAAGTAFVRMRKASLLRRERLLSILAGGSEEGDFGIRAVNSKSSVAQGETATRAEFVKCVFGQ